MAATISMAGIGDRLRQAREKRAITIDQVQKQTHINSRVIIALEEGKCDEILGPTYVKSFLKTYSRHIGLDPRELLGEYRSLHPEPDRPAVDITKSGPKNPVNTARFFYGAGAVGIITALIFLGLLLWGRTSAFLKSQKPVKAPAAKYRAKTPAKRQMPQKRNLKTDGLKLKEISRGDSFRKISPQAPVPKSGPFNLAVKVNQPVLIQLKKDGVLLFRRVLAKGSMESLRANESINIFVAKAEAIELILNGKTLNLPARGVVKDIEITRNGIRIK